MKKDRFEDILRSKLQDSEAGRAVPAWGEMERRLVLSENEAGVLPPKRKLGGGMKYGIAAAVALLIGFGVYQFGRHTGQMAASLSQDTAALQTLPGLDHALTADMLVPSDGIKDPALEKLFKSARSITPILPNQTKQNPLNRQLATLTVPEQEAPFGLQSPPEDMPDQAGQAIPAGMQANHGQASSPSQTRSATADRKASYRNGFDWNAGTRPQRRQWMVAAYTSAYASSASQGKILSSRTAFNAALVESNYTKNAQLFMGRNLEHHFPISVGFNVKKKITKRLGIETGLVYTYLESSAALDAEYSYKYEQKVHYLGIPLNLSYSLYQNKRLDVYLNAGPMAEFALSAKSNTRIFNHGEFASDIKDDLSASGVLWSVSMGAGVSYDFVNNFGIYLEPGAVYYVPNENQPVTYRTDNPWSFNVRVGFRFKF